MKKFKINEVLRDDFGILDGEAFTDNKGNPITLRFALLHHCGMYQAQNGEEAIRSYDIGVHIKNSPDLLMLEDAEYQFLIDKPLSQAKYVSMLMAKIFNIVKNAETVELTSTDESCLQESHSEKD